LLNLLGRNNDVPLPVFRIIALIIKKEAIVPIQSSTIAIE